MMERFHFEDDLEVFIDDDDLTFDEYIPPYHEELDFNKDPETEYLREEDELLDEDDQA